MYIPGWISHNFYQRMLRLSTSYHVLDNIEDNNTDYKVVPYTVERTISCVDHPWRVLKMHSSYSGLTENIPNTLVAY